MTPIAVGEFKLALLYNIFSGLWKFAGICLCTDLFDCKSFIIFFLGYSVVDLLLGSIVLLHEQILNKPVLVLDRQPQISNWFHFYTSKQFVVNSMTARCPGSPLHHRDWQVVCGVCADMLYFVFSTQDIVPEVLWFFQMQLSKPKPCCHVIFKETRLSPGNPSKQGVFVQSFANFSARNFDI